jgi:hypothetical protein
MEHVSEQVSSIVVLENGAGFPSWVAECQRKAPNSIVIAQSASSEASEFAVRAMTRIRDFTRSNSLPRVAILVCNPELDAEQLAARYRISRCLLASLDRNAPCELVLAIGDAHESSRHAILSLAGDLCEVVGSSSISVRVRFFGERRTSGTMASVVPAPVLSRARAASDASLK